MKQIEQDQPWNSLELPGGLDDHYRKFLRRELAEGLQDWQRDYRPLLGALVVAQGSGLKRTQLGGVVRRGKDELLPLLTACTQYLEGLQPDGPFRICRQSLRDFLLKDAEFRIDLSEAHRRAATYFLKAYAGEWRNCRDPYALQYTPIHLIEAMRHLSLDEEPIIRRELAADIKALLENDDFWQARAGDGRSLGNVHDFSLQAMLRLWSQDPQAREVLQSLLGVLAVARAPLAVEQLASFSGLENIRVAEGIEMLRPYLAETGPTTYILFQEALQQHVWQYLKDQAQYKHQRIANIYLEQYAGRWLECDSYGLSWLITHLVGAKHWPGLAAILSDGSFWNACLGKMGLPVVVADLRSAIELTPAVGTLRNGLL